MNEEKKRILEMLGEGKITAEEAAMLLDALSDEKPGAKDGAKGNSTPARMQTEPRLLRIRVLAYEDGKDKPVNVTVNIPLNAAKFAAKLLRYLPDDAVYAMEQKGVNLAEIDWEEMIDSLKDTGGDIVNISVDDDDNRVYVHIYVE